MRLLRRSVGVARRALANLLLRFAGKVNRKVYVGIDYSPNAENVPRYGSVPNRFLATLLANGVDEYRRAIEMIASYSADFRRIPVHGTPGDDRPRWVSDWLTGLDGAALYSFVRSRNPATYVEIGSGESTRFVRQACRDGGLRTRIVSIDPHPRSEIDGLCDTVIRSPLERADLELFSQLEPGDVVFFDGSHVTFMNNDVVVFFTEVLPALPPGVLVGIHDIYLPFDYPVAYANRYYSEQYVLAAFLLGGGGGTLVTLPCEYVHNDPDLLALVDSIWGHPYFAEVDRYGAAFWLRTREA